MGARPDHQVWQGKVYKLTGSEPGYPNLAEATGYGTGAGLKGWNCRHDFYPFIPGISERAYTDEELNNIDPPPFEYEGKTYDAYEASQMQRRMETEMRKTKRELIGFENAGLDDDYTATAIKLRRQKEYYKDFSGKAGLPLQNERTQVLGFGRKEAQKAVWAEKKSVAGGKNGGIINTRGKIMSGIQNIDSPIEQRNTAKGNPNAILQAGRSLNNRQQKLLESLQSYDSKVCVNKKSVNMKDLAALTAETGDEFAMFTKKGTRLIIRGNSYSVNVDESIAAKLSKEGYKWSGHTHPGINSFCLVPSEGDEAVLKQFNQEASSIYNSQGMYALFFKG